MATARAGIYTISGQFAKLCLLSLNLAVLGRLLGPAEFGIVALALSVVGVAELLRDFGLSTAAIQAEVLTQDQQSNLFWINTAFGAGVSLLIVAASPILGGVFHHAQLTPIMAALSAVFLFNGIQTQFQAKLARDFRFGTIALSDLISQVIGTVVGIAAALMGAGAWSLVGMQLAISFSILIIRMLYAHWLPTRYVRGAGVRSLVGFGVHLGLSQILGYISANVATLTLGRIESTATVGYFTRSLQVAVIPTNQIYFPLTNLIVSRLAKTTEAVSRARACRVIGVLGSYFGVGLYALLAVGAEPFVRIVLGEKWLPTISIIQLLAIAGVFQSLTYVYYWMFLVLGRTADLLRYNLITKGVMACAIVADALLNGAEGAAAAQAIVACVSWPICAIWLIDDVRFSAVGQFYSGFRAIVAAGLSTGVAVVVYWPVSAGSGSQLGSWTAGGAVWLVIWTLLVSRFERKDSLLLRREVVKKLKQHHVRTSRNDSRVEVDFRGGY